MRKLAEFPIQPIGGVFRWSIGSDVPASPDCNLHPSSNSRYRRGELFTVRAKLILAERPSVPEFKSSYLRRTVFSRK